MAVLSFKNDNGEIIISRSISPLGNETKERRFTREELKILVTKYLMYYSEGTTDISSDISLKSVCTALDDYFKGEPPKNFNKSDLEYWYCRQELYDYVNANKLFKITDARKTISAATLNRLKKASKKDNEGSCKESVSLFTSLAKDVQKLMQEELTSENTNNYKNKFSEACSFTTENLCNILEDIVIKEYGIFDKEVKCAICPLENKHKEDNGIYMILHKIWILLKTNDFNNGEVGKNIESLINELSTKESDIISLREEWDLNG